jgi:DivIVA domain-containing protein
MRDASSNEELENTTFNTALRGYDRDEVDAFVRTIAQEMRELHQVRNEKQYENLGVEMGTLLQHARDSADAMTQQAEQQAAEVRAAADADAQKIREEATARARDLQQQTEQKASETRSQAEQEASTRIADATERVRQLEVSEGQARSRLKALREELAAIAKDLRTLESAPAAEGPQTGRERSGNQSPPKNAADQPASETTEGEPKKIRLEPQESTIR